jgi:small subunit ribosomal protein S16
MPVRLRLQRFGKTHSPFYRMVAADSRAPRDGKFLEIVRVGPSYPMHISPSIHVFFFPIQVGTYNPIATKNGIKEIRLKADRLRYWISVGAQPTDRVAWILGKFGILPPPPQRISIQSSIPKDEREKEKK